MKYLSLILLAIPVCAQPTNIQVARTTSQQIVVGYDAPAGDDCTIELSESPTYSPVLPDVDGGLFSGANSDLSRPSTYVKGTRRMIVLGARVIDKADVGTDGKRYSRSLQQHTAQYGRLSNCGGTATFAVPTRVLPWGMIMDAYSTHPDMPGHYNFPSVNTTDRTETIRDPFTGMLLRKIQLPGDMVDTNEATALNGTATSSTWTNPANVTATADCGGVSSPTCVASYSGTTQGVLFIPNGTFSDSTNRGFLWRLEVDIVARVTGGATGEDAKLQICMGTATACDSPWTDFTVSTSTLASVTLGDDEPQTIWHTNGEYFPEQWWWSAGGVGYRIRMKTTNPAYTAEIDSLKARYKIGVNYNSSSSQYQQWHPLTVVEPADGKTYRLAYFLSRNGGDNPALYAIATDGTAHFMGTLHGSSPSNYPLVHIVFDRQDARTMYGYSTTGVVVKVVLSSASGTLSTDAALVDRDQGQSAKLTFTPLTATGYTLDDQVQAFNPLYTDEWKAKTDWKLHMDQAGKMIFKAQSSQDRGTWVAVFDPHATKPAGCATCEGAIVAAAPFGASNSVQNTKFCTVHAMSPGEQPDWIHIGTPHRDITEDSTYYRGPWKVQVKKPSCDIPTQDCSITTAMTTFEIVPQSGSYDFFDPAPGGVEDASAPLEVGDLLTFVKPGLTDLLWATGNEYMEVVSKNDVAHTITVRRGTAIMDSEWIAGTGFETGTGLETGLLNITNTAQSIPEGSYLYGLCRYTPLNENLRPDLTWNFDADPRGDKGVKPANNGIGTYSPTAGIRPSSDGFAAPKVQHFINTNNHGVWGKLPGKAFYADANVDWCPAFYTDNDMCYNMQVGNDNINVWQGPVNRTVQINGRFAGKDPVFGSSYQSHLRQSQQFGDASGRALEWMGDIKPYVNPTATVTLTSVSGNTWRYSGPTLERKHYPTMAFSGNRILRDISGPGSVIDDSKPWTYCVALVAGECVPTSTAGQIFANSPLKNNAGCYTSNGATNFNAYPTNTFGICIEDTPAYVFGPVQIDITGSDYDGRRMRALNMTFIRPGIQTTFAVPFASGDGNWVPTLGETEGTSSFWLVNTGDLPAPQDTLGNTFGRVNVDLYNPNAASFEIEFGYREEGAETDYYCTTRREKCVASSATVDDSNPFFFASETHTRVACTSGRCKMQIPRLDWRILFGRAKIYNAGGTLIETRVLPPQ